MHLQQRHGPDQQVVTSSDQVHIQQQMIPYQTVNAFIICDGVPRPKLNNDLLGAVPSQCPPHIIEQENVVGIRIKLEIRFQLRIVGDCEHLSRGVLQLYLTEIDGAGVEVDVKSFGVAPEVEGKLVAVAADEGEVIDGPAVHEGGRVVDLHRVGHLGRDAAPLGLEGDELVIELALIRALLDVKLRRHFGAILEDELLGD